MGDFLLKVPIVVVYHQKSFEVWFPVKQVSTNNKDATSLTWPYSHQNYKLIEELMISNILATWKKRFNIRLLPLQEKEKKNLK